MLDLTAYNRPVEGETGVNTEGRDIPEAVILLSSPRTGSMSDSERDRPRQLAELIRSLERLQEELEPSGGVIRPPTPRELARFTSDVTIPAIVLALETNVRALKLVQRALRLADGRDPSSNAAGARSIARDRAADLGRATLSQVEDVLADVQRALDDGPRDAEANALLDRVREAKREVDAQLAAADDGSGIDREPVDVDIDAELQSIREEIDGASGGAADAGGANGVDDGEGPGDDADDGSGDADTRTG